MTTNAAYFLRGLPMADYLGDRGRLSGHVLSMVETSPEDFKRWIEGTLPDFRTDGLDFGSYAHMRILEPDSVSRECMFYPSRAETMIPVMVPAIGKKGQPLKKLVPSATEKRPQDDTEAGQRLRMLATTDYTREIRDAFMAEAARRGKTVVYPEDHSKANAMVRAVKAHPEADLLLSSGEPEVTIHWTCPETGEPLQARPDWMCEDRRIWAELKTWTPKNDRERLDTMSPGSILSWCRQGWPRKSAIVHDGCTAVTGESWRGAWIVVESTEYDPRVSVVYDDPEMIGSFYTLGRDGARDRDGRSLFRGYIELVRMAQLMRTRKDFRHECTIGAIPHWRLPGHLLAAMEGEEPAVQITGAREVSNG